MSKYGKWILLMIALIAIIAIIAYFFFTKNTSPNTPSSGAERISTQINTPNISNITEPSETQEITETEIASFSTKILVEDDNRDNNLELTASKINNHIVKDGEEFSFNKVVGNPTPEKGYGGGNCQISTTLYDAVLKVDGLKVTERHEHGKEVGYVKQGDDATVVYDELDLKFKNNAGFDIKIYSDVTEEKVTVKIVKLST